MSDRPDDVSHGKSHKFTFESLSPAQKRDYLEKFAKGLQKYFSSDQEDEQIGVKQLMEEVQSGLDPRHFHSFLRLLHREGYLRLGFHFASERAEELRKNPAFRDLDITVVAGRDKDRFSQAAAEALIKELIRIGKLKKQRKDPVVNVGIVSGSTTGGVIRAAGALKWVVDLKEDAGNIPNVRVFALNVCLTVPEHLAGNANILAFRLAEKINDEAKKQVAEAFGLSAPLLIEKENLNKADESPQTFDVVRFTEPFRVKNKPDASRDVGPTDTELDLILTGVGELPDASSMGEFTGRTDSQAKGSIFYTLAKEFGFDMDKMSKEARIIGDIAFNAVRPDGEPVPLLGKYRKEMDLGEKRDDETEYLFYSAVQLPILEQMAKNRDKRVILVARYEEGKYKVPAIFASVAGERHRYASMLIIDEDTAQRLAHF